MVLAEYKTIGNVGQFIEVQTRYATELIQRGYVFTDPIPAALKPLTRALGPWPGRDNLAWPLMGPEGEGRVVSPNEKARLGAFDMYEVVAKPPVEIAGHTQRINPKVDFLNGGMSPQIAAEKVRRPIREWNRTVAREVLNVATAGAYKSGAARTAGYAFTVKDFNGTDVSVATETDTAQRAKAAIANANHLVQWPDRHGGVFAAGHNHLPADEGSAWTEALGRVARDHLLEHPGVSGVDAFVGSAVVDDVFEEIQDAAAFTPAAAQLLQQGTATEAEFGTPSFIGTVDGVRYFRLDDLPVNLAMYFARGHTPIGVSVGVQREDGLEAPYPWNNLNNVDNETKAVEYGYRGYAVAHIIEPTGIYIANYA